MLTKLLMGLLTVALLIAAMRQFMAGLRKIRVPVRPARPAAAPRPVAQLRQDPRTGVYYPEA